MDSRASVTSLWSNDMSRRDSEAIPEHDVDSSDSRTSFASAGSFVSSDSSRRYSESLARRRRSSVRSQVRRYVKRSPLFDRMRGTGRFVDIIKEREGLLMELMIDREFQFFKFNFTTQFMW